MSTHTKKMTKCTFIRLHGMDPKCQNQMDTPSCRNTVLPADVKSSLDCTWNKWLSSSLSSTRTHSAPNHSAPREKILGPYNLKTKPWRILPGSMFSWLKSQVMRADYLCPALPFPSNLHISGTQNSTGDH